MAPLIAVVAVFASLSAADGSPLPFSKGELWRLRTPTVTPSSYVLQRSLRRVLQHSYNDGCIYPTWSVQVLYGLVCEQNESALKSGN